MSSIAIADLAHNVAARRLQIAKLCNLFLREHIRQC